MGIFIILKCGGSLVKEVTERVCRQEFLVWFDQEKDHKILFLRYLFWFAGLVILVTYLTSWNSIAKLWNWHIRSDLQNHISQACNSNVEEEIYNNNLTVWRPYRFSFMSTCKLEQKGFGAEYHRNSQLTYTQSDWSFWSLLNYPRQRAKHSLSKLWILNIFG